MRHMSYEHSHCTVAYQCPSILHINACDSLIEDQGIEENMLNMVARAMVAHA
jgi:hypothetical protein